MNQRKAKALRKLARLLAVAKMKQMLSREEAVKVNSQTIVEFEKNTEPYIYDGEKIIVSPGTTRYFYKQLKRGG